LQLLAFASAVAKKTLMAAASAILLKSDMSQGTLKKARN
jgi:hypothetical protein